MTRLPARGTRPKSTRLTLNPLEDRSVPSAAFTPAEDDAAEVGHGPDCPCPDCGGAHRAAEQRHVHDENCGHDSLLDVFGHEFYEEPPLEGDGGDESDGDGGSGGSGGSGGGTVVPAFHSRPEATKKLFLDFDGHVVEGTYWNSRNDGNPIHAPAYSRDSDTSTFNDSELAAIEEAWKRVAEDFSPFNVDVTTEDPGDAAFTAGGQALRILISTDVDEATGNRWYTGAGGVAYYNSWYWTSDTPVWVFENNLGNGFAKYVAEAASHEAGHAFGIRHDGRTDPGETYYRGHGTGDTGWAPIMGVGYYKNLSQWSRGEYANANNTTEDDLDEVAAALGYVADDHAAIPLAATQLLPESDGSIAADGLIETRSDVDMFQFATDAGQVSIDVLPYEPGTGFANLDILAEVYDSDDNLVATSNPADALGASFDLNLAAGTYYLSVDGTGKGDPLADGYTDYSSIGWYTVSGTVVLPSGGNDDPVAVDDAAGTPQRSAVTIDVLANDTDPEGYDLIITGEGEAANGTVDIVSGGIRYSPVPGFAGTDTFAYTVRDPFGGSDTAAVTVTVTNIAPEVEVEDDYISRQGQALNVEVLEWAYDGGGDQLTVTEVTDPPHGGVVDLGDGTVDYTPDAGHLGQDSFSFTVSDPYGATASGTILIEVQPPNNAPDAGDDSVAVGQRRQVDIDVLANDADADADYFYISGVDDPANGTASIASGKIRYRSDFGFIGTDTFTYTVRDPYNGVGTATVTVEVTNLPPEADDDFVIAYTAEAEEIDIFGNVYDPGGDQLTLTYTDPAHGTLIEDEPGILFYTSGAGFVGTDTFDYTVTDTHGASDTATITIDVRPRNSPPVAADDYITTEESYVEFDVLTNDTDPDGDQLDVDDVTDPAYGRIQWQGGYFGYEAPSGFTGTDSFTYTVTDGEFSDTATVFVTVQPPNRAPVAQDDAGTVSDGYDPFGFPDDDREVDIEVVANDTDPDGDRLEVDSITQPSNGQASFRDGWVYYVADEGFVGTDSFTYTVSDNRGGFDTATVTIDVPALPEMLGESGTRTVSQPDRATWHAVNFFKTYNDPVVVMGAVSTNDADPVTARVRNVTPSGFEFQLQEFDYQDGAHGQEGVSWVVMERGVHTLEDGTRILAGTADVRTSWKTIDLSAAGFTSAPAVFTQVGSVNESAAVVSRVRNLSVTGFQARLREQESGDGHVNETVAYLAVEAAAGGDYEVGFTGDVVKHNTDTVAADAAALSHPVFLAGMVTQDGGDTSNVRYFYNGDRQAVVNIAEEQSRDSELGHTTENVAYFLSEYTAFRGSSD